MSAIEWGVLFCAACLIIGSFSYIKPSPKQKREAKIRMQAIKMGLLVKQRHLNDLSVSGRVNNLKKPFVFFKLPVNGQKAQDQKIELEQTFLIQRTSGECGIHLDEGWAWSEKNNHPEVIEFIQKFLKKQTEHIHAIEVNKFYVALAWDEKPDESYIEILQKNLQELLGFSLKFKKIK